MTDFQYAGTHLVCDAYDIDPAVITHNDRIVSEISSGIRSSGATLCGIQIKEFDPAGLTAVFLLAESHVSVHTYPEHRALFADVFTCGSTVDPRRILEALLESLGDCSYTASVIDRGISLDSAHSAETFVKGDKVLVG
ncbi:adenosylmethionine decarboxylase [Streptomyces sp. CA-111067]|jgi:S-adenosylmethionine decarboxylase|uniref:adenosylmethionine decarboxylase n=1 Tax=Streptomyces sp. CA-111067 TaxID=3240046 RepID=UPI003D952789